jgi:hypothetical protein
MVHHTLDSLHPAPGWISLNNVDSCYCCCLHLSDRHSPRHPRALYPNFLDVLLPPRPDANVGAPVPKSAFMDALKSVAHHKITQNGAPAFSSTLSSTLDAFQSLSIHMDTLTIDGVLARAWAEDPALTLKIIWNTRSIHDGRSDKELFYRYVQVRPSCARFPFAHKSMFRPHLGLLVGSMSTTHVR